PQERAVAMWDRLLQSGRRVTGVGASDWHRAPDRLDAASVRVLTDSLTEAKILDGIRRGHVIVMRDAREAPPVIAARCGTQRAGIGDTLTCDADDSVTIAVASSAEPNTDGDRSAAARVDLIWNGRRIESTRGLPATFKTGRHGSGYARIQTYTADGTA